VAASTTAIRSRSRVVAATAALATVPLGLVAAAVIQLGVLVVVIAAMLVVENLVLSPVATEG
jgi:hypothetical protein